MNRTWVWMLLFSALSITFITGCDSGSGSNDGPYSSYTFINDTDERIQVFRDGSTEWEGSDSFQLVDRGDERTVTLKETGDIGYGYTVLDSGDVDTETIGNQIFFR